MADVMFGAAMATAIAISTNMMAYSTVVTPFSNPLRFFDCRIFLNRPFTLIVLPPRHRYGQIGSESYTGSMLLFRKRFDSTLAPGPRSPERDVLSHHEMR